MEEYRQYHIDYEAISQILYENYLVNHYSYLWDTPAEIT
jgi:hypothetical protein